MNKKTILVIAGIAVAVAGALFGAKKLIDSDKEFFSEMDEDFE